MASDDDFIKKLLEDVRATGYPTELAVAKAFEDSGWVTNPNTYYIDKDENKGREIDLVCWLGLPSVLDEQESQFLLCASVSIKQSANRPWVIFTSPTTGRDCMGREFLTILQERVQLLWPQHQHPPLHPISQAPRIGRTHYEGFSKGGEKAITEALLSSVKGAVSEYDKQFSVFGDQKGKQRQSFFFQSAIVLSGRLFECYALPDGSLSLSEVSYLPFVCNYTSTKYDRRQYLVEFVTIEGLSKFLASQTEWLTRLQDVAYKRARKQSG
jgi:hypothetical protein